MPSLDYMLNRKKYGRPQAMLWANNPGNIVEDEEGNKFYIPLGNEVGSSAYTASNEFEFIILSDHNRSDLNFATDRIGERIRMANGRLRSYHVADKLSLSTGWEMLPSRSYALYPDFDSSGDPTTLEFVEVDSVVKPVQPYGSPYYKDQQFTVDGGAGGAEILDWYDRYTESFWVYLSYDKHTNFRDPLDVDEEYRNLPKYSQVVEMMFVDFSHNVIKRGATTHDFWNIDLSLEEV